MITDPRTDPPRHLRVEEFADRYGVNRRTVYYWIKWGWLPAVKVCGGLRIPADVLPRIATDREFVKIRRHAS